ncbi:MAG: type II secretion system protein [Victivallaceae bacterium]
MRSYKFTLVELLVVMVIICALAALSFPVYNKIRNSSKMTACLNNLKQIGICINSYATDNKDALPRCARLNSADGMPALKDVMRPYAGGNVKIFECPADVSSYKAFGSSYEWNTMINGMKIDKHMFVIGTNLISAPFCGDVDNFHAGKRNYLYSDGKIKDVFELQIK